RATANASLPSVRGDGPCAAFDSLRTDRLRRDTNGDSGVCVHTRRPGATQRGSVASDGAQGNAISTTASISGDGRFVAFQSAASNLVSGDTNGATDVFVHDRQSGMTEQLSGASDGRPGKGNTRERSV